MVPGNEQEGVKCMFRIFATQEERRKFGGSAFVEIQFCRMQPDTEIRKLIAVDNIDHWQDDSLYIYFDDVDDFVKEYGEIFDCGIYNNLRTGPMDIYGINYYRPDLIEKMVAGILGKKAADGDILIEWLERAKSYNGFYILGI